jgi:hypothetical protein
VAAASWFGEAAGDLGWCSISPDLLSGFPWYSDASNSANGVARASARKATMVAWSTNTPDPAADLERPDFATRGNTAI